MLDGWVLLLWLHIIRLAGLSEFWHHLGYFLIMNFVADFWVCLMCTVMVKQCLGKYPMSYCFNQLEGYKTVKKTENFQKTELSFRLIWFEKFLWVCYSWSMRKWTYCLSSVLFGHKNVSSEYFCKKLYQTWPTTVETFKEHQTVPTITHKNRQILDF